MNHKKTIEKYSGSLEDLGKDIWDLDYDTLVQIFEILTKKFQKDADHDKELNHPKVSEYLTNISKALEEILKRNVQPLADLCRSYNERWIK